MTIEQGGLKDEVVGRLEGNTDERIDEILEKLAEVPP